jgi:hypothetical protein
MAAPEFWAMNEDLKGNSLADVLEKLEKGKIGHRAAIEWLNGRGAQFPELGALLLCDRPCLVIAGLRRFEIACCPEHVAAQP